MNDTSPSAAARAVRIAAMHTRAYQSAWETYDGDRHLVYQPAAGHADIRVYRQAASLPLALALLQDGDAESVAEAGHIVEAILPSQETSPTHPHRGNWLWLVDDPEIGDLNAVQFVLRGLLPVLEAYAHLLPPDLVARCRVAVRLALEEEERLDVAPTYTNIHIMSLFALLVGAQWLQDEHFWAVGRQRWKRWVQFTVESGAPHEYNSPNYGGVDLSALAALYTYVKDPAVKLQARLLYERFWLHFGLRLHRPTGQLAGPHCRCYWPPMMSGRGPVKDLLWRETGWDWLLEPGSYGGDAKPPDSLELALGEHNLPDTLRTWFLHQDNQFPFEIRETANKAKGFDLTTYCSPSYTLGTASRTYEIGTDCFYIEHQANHLIAYYQRPAQKGGWGMIYSRYVVNDRHWGTLGAAPDRDKTANFYDQGHFAGVQLGNKAIGLYALKPQHEEVFSLKTVVAFQSPDLDRVWVNDSAVEIDNTPLEIEPGKWLIVEDGDVYIGVWPLEPSCLGREAPILVERGPLGELWLSIYNYRGAPVRFWDYASLHGAFWRGNLRAGFVVEISERDHHPSAADFLAHLQNASVTDRVDTDHIRTVTYTCEEDQLALRYDLWNTRPVERLLDGIPYDPPSLQSPFAAQGDSGRLHAGSATLETNPQPIWLLAQEIEPSSRAWIAVNPENRPTPLRWQTACGEITAESWGLGRLEWRAPESGEQVLIVQCIEEPSALSVPVGVRVILQIEQA